MPVDAQNERIDAIASALRWMILVIALVTAALIFAVGWQSYQGRVDVVTAQRARCTQVEKQTFVAVAESLSSWHANSVVASDTSQSQTTRDARRAQAETNLRAAEVRELSLPRAWRRTRAGRLGPEFSCEAAYPSPSPWPWDQ